MSDEDEDKPTVVLDFSAMKEELQESEDLTNGAIEVDIDAIVGTGVVEENDLTEDLFGTQIEEDTPYNFNIYLFDFKTTFFEDSFENFDMPSGLTVLKELPELNSTLTEDPASLIVFYYNANPKAVNQLAAQIRKKFAQARTMIIANNLSEKKAQAHASTKSAADTYLSNPFTSDTFHEAVTKINW